VEIRDVCVVQHGDKEPTPGDPGLTESGRRDIALTGASLARERWDRLYSSPLRRARETAELIAETCAIDVVTDDRLRERMNWGDGPPQGIASFASDWEHASVDRAWVPPSGDSSLAAAARMRAALEDFVTRDARVIVVGHGGVTTDLLRSLFGDSAVRRAAPEVIESGIQSGSLTRLRWMDGRWSLVVVASRAHLPGA